MKNKEYNMKKAETIYFDQQKTHFLEKSVDENKDNVINFDKAKDNF